jgi:hypothetical protein
MSARLRHAFKYNEDSDSGHSSLEALDETEQDQLIANLKARDSSTTHLYRRLFTALPLFSILPYLLFRPGFVLSLLSITSFIASAYILERIPLPSATSGWRDVVLPQANGVGIEDGPIRRYLVPLTGALAAMVVLNGWVRRGNEVHGEFALSTLPMCKLECSSRTTMRRLILR